MTTLNNHFQKMIEDGELQCATYCLSRKGKIFAHGAVGKRTFRADDDTPALPAAETILIQGIIDVFFAEEDGLVIVDYKSDAVNTPAELINRYQKQLDYYQEALEQLTGKPVKEKLIYLSVGRPPPL